MGTGVNRLYRFLQTSVHWHVCWGSLAEVGDCKRLTGEHWAAKHSALQVALSKLATYAFVAFAAWGLVALAIVLARAV